LELLGLHNVRFGGNDLEFMDDMVPPNIFHRNFNVSFEYEFYAISAFARKFGKNFLISPEPK